MKKAYGCAIAALALAISTVPAAAQNVKITPLGTHAGELCDRDRSTLFEDPTGVRILYDVGHSLTGADDTRLGDVHAGLLSDAHGDHIGDRKVKAIGAGTCATPDTLSAGAHSMTAEVTAHKNAALVVGFVVKFTNGLTVYLTGDTGTHTEMKNVVADYHKANLTVFNLGPNAIDAQAGAYAVNKLIRSQSVIVSHVNEAATEGGKLRPNTRTAAFVKLLKTPAHLAISGRTMDFDGKGVCVAGCQ